MANLIRRSHAGPIGISRTLDPFEMMRDLMRWEPLGELWPTVGREREITFAPDFEVKEKKDAYVFKADLPGIREQDLDISLTGNRLTVSGKRDEEKREEEERYYCYERSYGSFSRSFTLPEGVDVDHAAAELTAGVLTLHLPKRPEVKPKRIEVKKVQAGKAHA